jgi:hypothetical protein
MSKQPDLHRHFDAADYARASVAIFVLKDLVRLCPEQAVTLFDRYNAEWSSDVLRPEGWFGSLSDVLAECDDIHQLVAGLSNGDDRVDVPDECLVAQQLRAGTPDTSWVRYCPTCATTHLFAGYEAPDDYDGEFGVPILMSEALARRLARNP